MIWFTLAFVQSLSVIVIRHLKPEAKWAAAAACNPSWLWECICVYLTPSLPSAPCIVIHAGKGTCVHAWWLHNSRATFVVATSRPDTSAPAASVPDCFRCFERHQADKYYEVPSTHVYSEGGGAMSHTHTDICRWCAVQVHTQHAGPWLTCELVRTERTVTLYIIMPNTTRVFVLVCPPSGCRRSQRFKEH